MRIPIIASVGLHVVIVVGGIVGLPAIRPAPPIPDLPIVVDIVELGAITNLPTASELKKEPPKAEEPKKIEAKPKPKPPPPPKAKAPPPPPPPSAPAKEEVAAVPPPPKPKPEAKAKPKPKPEPKVEPKKEVKAKPKTPTVLAKAKPRRKPAPPDPLAGVLKTLERLEKQAPAAKEEEKKTAKKKPEFDPERLAKALSRRPVAHDPNRRISISERDALVSSIKRQLEPCWNLPAGAKDFENMVIQIKVAVNRDGRVRAANIENSTRMFADPFFRAAAESALRAVKNPRCSPLKLPAENYDVWKDLTLVFNPKDMFGG